MNNDIGVHTIRFSILAVAREPFDFNTVSAVFAVDVVRA
jgi:hypothetical protein